MTTSLVASGFFAAATHRLAPVLATVLPALIILGIYTFVRLVETSVEDMIFLRRIGTIRRYYATLDPAAAAFFPSAEETAVTSIEIGAGVALVLGVAGAALPAAVIVGVAAALLAYGLHTLWMYHRGRPAMV